MVNILESVNNKRALAVGVAVAVVVILLIVLISRESMISDGPNVPHTIGGGARNRAHHTEDHNNPPWEQDSRSTVSLPGHTFQEDRESRVMDTEMENSSTATDEIDLAASDSNNIGRSDKQIGSKTIKAQMSAQKANVSAAMSSDDWSHAEAGNKYAVFNAKNNWNMDTGDARFTPQGMPQHYDNDVSWLDTSTWNPDSLEAFGKPCDDDLPAPWM